MAEADVAPQRFVDVEEGCSAIIPDTADFSSLLTSQALDSLMARELRNQRHVLAQLTGHTRLDLTFVNDLQSQFKDQSNIR